MASARRASGHPQVVDDRHRGEPQRLVQLPGGRVEPVATDAERDDIDGVSSDGAQGVVAQGPTDAGAARGRADCEHLDLALAALRVDVPGDEAVAAAVD